jgi:capsule polysaccharide export protein KpsE/RkpR
MSLGERLLKYVETVITLTKSLEETKGHIRDVRSAVLQHNERIIRLEERVESILRELELRDQKIAAELSRQIQERLPPPKKR